MPPKRKSEEPVKKAVKKAKPIAQDLPLPITETLPLVQPAEIKEIIEKLSKSEAEFLALEIETIPSNWLKLLLPEFKKPYYQKLKKFLAEQGLKGLENSNEGIIFPPARNVFSWTRYTSIEDVRVVIIGQDPYHDDNQAHGLAFSVMPGIKIPPSLRNIYKELQTEYPDFKAPNHGYLISYAQAGVLLLNTALTVTAHKAGSHSKKGWEQFTQAVVDIVAKRADKGVVFMAWGAHAQKRVTSIDTKKHLVLSSAHPSPLSARGGFFGNNHFKSANEWLEKRYDQGIDWTKL